MKKIWKYPLEVTDKQSINVPEDAEFMCIQIQHGEPCLWVKCDPDATKNYIVLNTYGTGHTIENDERDFYIGTYQLSGGNLVFHVFGEG